MTILLFLNAYIDIIVRWWKVNISLFVTWILGLFGDPIADSVVPDFTPFVTEFAVALATIFMAGVTVYLAWKKGKRELDKIEQSVCQERQEHRLKMLSELKNKNLAGKNSDKVDDLIATLINDLDGVEEDK